MWQRGDCTRGPPVLLAQVRGQQVGSLGVLRCAAGAGCMHRPLPRQVAQGSSPPWVQMVGGMRGDSPAIATGIPASSRHPRINLSIQPTEQALQLTLTEAHRTAVFSNPLSAISRPFSPPHLPRSTHRSL